MGYSVLLHKTSHTSQTRHMWKCRWVRQTLQLWGPRNPWQARGCGCQFHPTLSYYSNSHREACSEYGRAIFYIALAHVSGMYIIEILLCIKIKIYGFEWWRSQFCCVKHWPSSSTYIGGTDPAVILELSPKSNHSDKPTIDKQPSFKKKQLRRSNEQIGLWC